MPFDDNLISERVEYLDEQINQLLHITSMIFDLVVKVKPFYKQGSSNPHITEFFAYMRGERR